MRQPDPGGAGRKRKDMSGDSTARAAWRWWVIGSAAIVGLALVWLLRGIDPDQLYELVAGADPVFLVVLLLTVAAEQIVRAWKWRQLLHGLRPVGTLRLFGTIMAGYFVGMLIPLGISPLVRSWLVARLEGLGTGTVLATAAIDRLVDGLVFSVFVFAALGLAVFPDPGGVRLGLVAGGVGGLVLFASILAALARYRKRAGHRDAWITRLAGWLPDRFSGAVKAFAVSFAEGIVWPREAWRGGAIVLASFAIKFVALSYFLWAGLAFGIVLAVADYLFLLAFLGFLVIVSRAARIPGGFLLGSVFALDLLGVEEEPALAMTAAVQFATMLTVAATGAFALWRQGMTLGALRAMHREDAGPHDRLDS